MDYPPRNRVKVSTSYLEQTKKKDGTLVSRTKEAVHERSDRHDALILRCPGKFVSSTATASRLVACPVCRLTGLCEGMGQKIATPLPVRTTSNPAFSPG